MSRGKGKSFVRALFLGEKEYFDVGTTAVI
jgi:hypothetical protein